MRGRSAPRAPLGARVTSAPPDRLSLAVSMIRRTIRRVSCGAPLAGVVLALLAQSAAAASLSVTGTCFASGQQLVVTGTTFTPLATVAIGGAVVVTARADAAGTFRLPIAAPAITGLGPSTVTVTAVDGANAANAATLRLNVVRAAFGSKVPIAGRPHDTTTWRVAGLGPRRAIPPPLPHATTTWRFAGFAPGRPIYAHFLLGARSRGDSRFGVARGACGTLAVRAPRIPGVRTVQPGRWTLKLDQRPTYHERTAGSEATFRIVRRANGDGGGRDRRGGRGRSARA